MANLEKVFLQFSNKFGGNELWQKPWGIAERDIKYHCHPKPYHRAWRPKSRNTKKKLTQ